MNGSFMLKSHWIWLLTAPRIKLLTSLAFCIEVMQIVEQELKLPMSCWTNWSSKLKLLVQNCAKLSKSHVLWLPQNRGGPELIRMADQCYIRPGWQRKWTENVDEEEPFSRTGNTKHFVLVQTPSRDNVEAPLPISGFLGQRSVVLSVGVFTHSLSLSLASCIQSIVI